MLLAHDIYIVARKKKIERQNNSLLKCIGVRYMLRFIK